jgi:hypothetical protein
MAAVPTQPGEPTGRKTRPGQSEPNGPGDENLLLIVRAALNGRASRPEPERDPPGAGASASAITPRPSTTLSVRTHPVSASFQCSMIQ